VLSLGAAALAVALWHAWQRLGGGGRLSGGDGASWAGRRDLRALVVRRNTPLTGRIVLGRTPWRQTIATPHRHSLLVFSPTLSGKTSSFVIPTLLRWRGPVIATSSKVDMLLATLPARRQRGSVFVFDPFLAAGIPAIHWSPLVGSSTWPEALDMAYWLTQAARPCRTASRTPSSGSPWPAPCWRHCCTRPPTSPPAPELPPVLRRPDYLVPAVVACFRLR